MSSSTGLIFSYAIGLIFFVGGIMLLFTPVHPLLLGIPYIILGAVILLGIHMGRRRRKRREAREAALLDDAETTGLVD
jgi:hypothetical protein